MRALYLNNTPAPHMIERINVLSRQPDLGLLAAFVTRSESDRSWAGSEHHWRFPPSDVRVGTRAAAGASRESSDRCGHELGGEVEAIQTRGLSLALVKIAAEGAELDILRGCLRLVTETSAVLVVEFTDAEVVEEARAALLGACWAIFVPIIIRAGFMPAFAWFLYFYLPTRAGIALLQWRPGRVVLPQPEPVV